MWEDRPIIEPSSVYGWSEINWEISKTDFLTNKCGRIIGMEFKITKCSILNMKREKEASCRGLRLSSGETIGEPDGSGYRQLGILVLGDILHREMKVKASEAYQNNEKETSSESFHKINDRTRHFLIDLFLLLVKSCTRFGRS